MFTGIVEELGEVVALDRHGDSARLTVRGPTVTSDAGHGDSIALNGCCLTVSAWGAGTFSADVMGETLDKTSLGALAVGDHVNLERPVTLQTRMGGHLVQGHVDGTGTLVGREPSEHWETVTIAMPATLAPYVAMKGSIAVDGVSLTVSDVSDVVSAEPGRASSFAVSLIPTTLESTTLGLRAVGDVVNLEVDVMAKYAERLLRAGAGRRDVEDSRV
ncbi:MAG: riboflavin synthase [Nocardioidaceae bacterium]